MLKKTIHRTRIDGVKQVAVFGLALASLFTVPTQLPAAGTTEAVDIGSRRELFIDAYLIDKIQGARQRLHHPVPREIAIVHDAPWEGTGSGYHSIFHDGEK